MTAPPLARADPPRELAATAFELYETFGPAVTEGVKGWGAKGVLDLGTIRALAKGWPSRRGPQAPGARFCLGGSAARAARSMISCGNRGKQAGINNRE